MSDRKRIHIVVRGRVRGSRFRIVCQSQARRLGVVGWVRTRWDGSVEVVGEGKGDALLRLRDWCKRGPLGSTVAWLEESQVSATGEFSSFDIRR